MKCWKERNYLKLIIQKQQKNKFQKKEFNKNIASKMEKIISIYEKLISFINQTTPLIFIKKFLNDNIIRKKYQIKKEYQKILKLIRKL